MEFQEAVELFIAGRRRANCASGTLKLYRHHLTTWHQWLIGQHRSTAIAELSIAELRDFADYLLSDYVAYSSPTSSRPPLKRPLSDNTRASYHRTLRAFWSFLEIEGALSPEQRLFFKRLPAPRVPEDPRPATDEDVVKRLIAACGDGSDEESARNRAILQLLAETGMRIGELCALTDEVTDTRRRRARILRPKNKRHRMVFWQPSGAAALARYLLLRRGKVGGPLFRGCSIRNNGGALTPDAVRKAIQRIAEDARIALPFGAPLHSIRHGFAHAALDAGAEITDLADLLGHADLETTRIYLRNDDTRLAAAYERIFSRGAKATTERRKDEKHG